MLSVLKKATLAQYMLGKCCNWVTIKKRIPHTWGRTLTSQIKRRQRINMICYKCISCSMVSQSHSKVGTMPCKYGLKKNISKVIDSATLIGEWDAITYKTVTRLWWDTLDRTRRLDFWHQIFLVDWKIIFNANEDSTQSRSGERRWLLVEL